jgi:predicted Zn finger-like uncharacterized protein
MAVGDEAMVRRVLLAWSIRSARLLQQVNIEEWLKQESASDDSMTRFSEMTTSSSMYTTRRLRLLGQAAREPELMRWSQSIQPIRQKLAPEFHAGGLGVGTVKAVKTAVAVAGAARPAVPSAVAAQAGAVAPVQASAGQAAAANPATPAAPADSIRVICNKCHAAMRVPLAVLRGKTMLNVRCPQCRTVIVLRPKAAAPAAGAPAGAAAAGSAAPAGTAGVAAAKPVAPTAAAGGATTKPVAVAAVHRAATKPVAAAGTGGARKATAPPVHAGGKK